MHQLVVRVATSKTHLLNVDEVGQNLRVAPSYIVAFLGYALGVSSKYLPLNPPAQRATVGGSHTPAKIAAQLHKFIQEAVICSECGLPELTLAVRGATQEICSVCSACGASVPRVHFSQAKFGKFVQAHPPAIRGSTEITGGGAFGSSSSAAGGLCSNSSLERELVALEMAANQEKKKDRAAAAAAKLNKQLESDEEEDVPLGGKQRAISL